MADEELYQFPQNLDPFPLDFLYMSNETESGNASESVTYVDSFAVVAKLASNPSPLASDRFLVAPLAGSAYQYDAQSLSDYLATLQPVEISAIGETNFQDNALETTIAAANTPVKINAVYVDGANNTANMTTTNGRITNNSAEPLTFQVGLSVSASFVSTSGSLNVYVYVDGLTPVPGLISQVDVDAVSPSYESVSVDGSVTLNPGQYAEAFVSNVDSTDNVIVKSCTLIASTIGAFSQAASVNTVQRIATVQTALEFYTSFVYETVWIDFFPGESSTVLANTFQIGETIEMDLVGTISKQSTVANSDGGSILRLTFGPHVLVGDDNIAFVDFSTLTNRSWHLKAKVTRIGASDIVITIDGGFTTDVNTYKPIIIETIAGTYNYNENIDNVFILEFLNNNSAGNAVNFIANNLNIIKYT